MQQHTSDGIQSSHGCVRPRTGHILLAGLLLAVLVGVFGLLPPTRPAIAAAPESWTATGSMATPRYGHTATVLSNGKVLVAGGQSGSVIIAAVELYDPATGTWTATGGMAAPRAFHTATLLPSGKVLVAGGFGNGAVDLSSAEIYDPATGAWGAAGSFAGSPRRGHTATLLADGRVLVAGGFFGSGNAINTAELYNPATTTWAATGSMAAGRGSHTATLLATGKVLVAGGFGAGFGAELYDPAAGTWSTTGNLVRPRVDHTATLLPDGRVLAAGGSGDNSVETFNPATGTWSLAGRMSAVRQRHMAVLLSNTTVLVAGGAGSGPLAAAEIFDPATGLWSPTGTVLSVRQFATASLLPSGLALIAGGLDSAGVVQASAELYTPAEPAPGVLIADSVADFSGTQGANNWFYGYYTAPFTGATFQQLAQFSQDCYYLRGTAYEQRFAWCYAPPIPNPFWTSLWNTGGVPQGNNLHWAVRRWVSEVTGPVTLSGTLAVEHPGCPDSAAAAGHILVNGVEIWSQNVAGSTRANVSLTTTVTAGAFVDFAIDPLGPESCDAITFFARIRADAGPVLNVAANNPSVMVTEGQTATMSGTYTHITAGENVVISGSAGTLTKTGTSSGTWSWSYPTTDGPAQSALITITARDGAGLTRATTFSLTVTNVAPTATFTAPPAVDAGSPIPLSLTDASDPSTADTAIGFTHAFDCGDGAGYGALGTAAGRSCPTTAAGSRTVKGKIRDKDGGETEYTAAVTVNAPAAPDLALAKSHTGNFTVGTNGVYTLTVTNAGTAPTTGTITVTDSLPAGLGFVSGTGAGWSCAAAGQTVTCTSSGPLAAGASSSITLTVTVAAAAAPSVINTASVVMAGESNTGNNAASDLASVNLATAGEPGVTITSIASPSPVVLGTNITYTLTVTNDGAAATDVVVTDTLSSAITFVSATPGQGACTQAAGKATCTLGTLAGGARTTITVVGTPTAAGSLGNAARVTWAGALQAAPNSVANLQTTVNPPAGDSCGDKTPPLISEVSPKPDSFVSSTRPLITARVRDDGSGLDVARITVLLDGVPLTATFTATEIRGGAGLTAGLAASAEGDGAILAGTITAQPLDPLGAGPHSLEMSVYDNCRVVSILPHGWETDPLPPNITLPPPTQPPGGGGSIGIGGGGSGTMFFSGPGRETFFFLYPYGNTVAIPNTLQPGVWDIIIECSDAAGNTRRIRYTIIVTSTGVQVVDQVEVPAGASGTASTAPQASGQGGAATRASVASSATTGLVQHGVVATLTNATAGTDTANLMVATYAANPTTMAIPNPSGGFTDLHVAGADATDSVAARFYYPSAVAAAAEVRLGLRFFDGTAWQRVRGSGGAAPARDTTDNLDSTVSGGRFAVTLDNTSTPKVTELTGTVFAVVEDTADLSVTLADAPDPVTAGSTLTYTATVANAGPDDAAAVTLTDTLPANVSFGAATAGQGACSRAGGTVSCALGTIAAGASVTATITVTPAAAGPLSNTVSIAGGAADPDAGNNSATASTAVQAALTPDFSIEGCTPATPSAAPGGSAQSSCSVTSLDGFSAAVALSCTGPPAGAACSFTPESVTPPANGQATAALTVSIGGSVAPGSYPFKVKGTSGALSHDTSLTLTVTGAAGISIDPAAIDFGAQTVNVASGDRTATIKNTGATALTLSGITLEGANAADFRIVSGGGAGTLAANGTRTVTLRFTPGAAGARSADLVVTHGAAGSPSRVTLTGLGITDPIVKVNDRLRQDSVSTSTNTSDKRAPAGVYTITAKFTNTGTAPLMNLSFLVASLTGGNTLLNRDAGTPAGAGARLTVPASALGGDGILSPGEQFTVKFEIGLATRNRFTFLVDAYGVVQAPAGAGATALGAATDTEAGDGGGRTRARPAAGPLLSRHDWNPVAAGRGATPAPTPAPRPRR